MPETPSAIRSLESLCDCHAVFEADQVLNHEQLNSIAEYFDDQGRLTRVRLVGTGIVEGLHVRFEPGAISIAKGLGITADGDLVLLDQERRFTHARAYSPAVPAPPNYPPFLTAAKPELHELLTDAIPQSVKLSDLPGGLDQRMVIAYVESRVSDADLCTGVDCDNHGQSAIHTLRFLVAANGDGLATLPSTVAERARGLPRLFVRRATIGPGTSSAASISVAYASANETTIAAIGAAFAEFDSRLGAFASAAGSPGGEATLVSLWNTVKATLLGAANANAPGQLGAALAQHRFLRDLVDAWNELADALAASDLVLDLPPAANVKHLVLAGTAPARLSPRSRFVPAPTGRATVARQRAEFRLHRLVALMRTFRAPDQGGSLVVTPSRSESAELGERALPSHYATVAGLAPAPWWSERATLGGSPLVGATLADSDGGSGSPRTMSPATALARHRPLNDFFLIDGARGKAANGVVAELKKRIADQNLPFAVAAVSLGTKVDDVLVKPPLRYGDLHRLHKLIRFQLATHVRRVEDFTKSFVTKVEDSRKSNVIEVNVDRDAKLVDSRQKIQAASASAQASVSNHTTFQAARTDTALKEAITIAREHSIAATSLLADHLTMTHITPADPLAVRLLDDWPRWLEELVDQREQGLNERLLLSKFIVEHPGLEHLGGVERGGTFVLVYDAGGIVVADFALPYRVADEAEADPGAPTLTAEPTAPGGFIGGIVLRPSRDRWFEEKEIKIRKDLKSKWEVDLEDRLGSMKKSTEILFGSLQGNLSQLVLNPKATSPNTPKFVPRDDNVAKAYESFTTVKEEVVKLREEVESPSTPDDRRAKASKQLTETEAKLVAATANLVNASTDAKLSVEPESDGDRVLKEALAAGAMVKSQEHKKKLAESIESKAKTTNDAPLKAGLNKLANSITGL